MGALERIRNTSPYILAIFAVVLIAFFVLSDADIGGILQNQNSPQNAVVGEVNGKELKYIEFQQQVAQSENQQRSQNGDDAQINRKQINKQVWNSMVEEVLLQQQADKIGLNITSEIIAKDMLKNPPQFMRQQFTDSAGNFMKSVYLEYMTDPEGFYATRMGDMPEEQRKENIAQFRNQIINITEYMKDQKRKEMIMSTVNNAGSFISKKYAERKYINENSEMDVNYISWNVSEVKSDDITITDEDLKEYYERNKSQFEQKPKRKIKYATFKLKPSAKDTADAKRDIGLIVSKLREAQTPEKKDTVFTDILNKFNGDKVDYTLANELDKKLAPYLLSFDVGEVKGPISLSDGSYFIRVDDTRDGENTVVKASHILISTNDNADSAMTIAKDVLSKAKSGEDFGQLARQYSQDKGSARNGGDLGYFGEGQMVKPFQEAAFAAEAGDIVGPVETKFGYHIIYVEDKKSTEVKYSYVKISPDMSRSTENMVKRSASDFQKQVKEGANFDTLAAKMELNVVETAPFSQNRPILSSQYLTDLVFNAEEGNVLEIVELDNYGMVVAQVVEIDNSKYASLEDKEQEIRAQVKNEKALAILKERAQQLYSKIKNEELLAGAAKYNTEVNIKTAEDIKNNGTVPGIGRDYVFTAKALSSPLGKISEPFIGENNVFMIQVVDKNTPSDEEVAEALPDYLSKLKAQNKANSYFMWFNKLKENSEIVDKRYMHYKEY